MPHIDLPEGDGSAHDRMYRLRPEYADPAAAMLDAVWNHTVLPPRLAEAVRHRIAQLNGCLLCLEARHPAAAAVGFGADDYAAVDTWRDSERFDERERLALEFTEAFVGDHHAIDGMWPSLRDAFSDPELVDLAFYVGRFLSFGRLTQVLGLDDSCGVLPSSVPT